MKFNLLKTRRGKLVDNLKSELSKPKPSLDKILEIVQDYENNNLNTIEKLKRDKKYEAKRISGALKQTIHAHGPITLNLIGSATKRIYGSLLSNEQANKISRKTILTILALIGVILLCLI